MKLDLGDPSTAARRRDALVRRGIFTIDGDHPLTGIHPANLAAIDQFGPDGLRIIRRFLYQHRPRLALKREDPEGYPKLVDSLLVTTPVFICLMNLRISTIEQLKSRMGEPRVRKLSWVARALERHQEEFGF
ncbi:MAG TPA: hypothetical protein VMS08_03665 [Candidatus Saccharimonadia bacterium]|jgi:hypothetical protein|nr:hypothetical protein [Candidatus Saccharimonadia bacterium]